MPAVQTAFGPIVEPGWPDLKGPDMGAKFLSGAYIMGNINAKRQALENQMAQYALKIQGMEQENSLKEKKYELDKQALEQRGDVGFWRADIAERRLGLQGDIAQSVVDEKQKKIDGNRAVINAVTSMYQDGIGKDDPRYGDELPRRVISASPYADQALIRQVLQANLGDYNLNANRQDQALIHREKMFLDKMGSKLYGDPTLHLTGPIEDPSQYPEEKTGGSYFGPFGLPTFKKSKEELTGYRTGTITLPSGETVEKKFKTTDLTTLAKEWKAIQEAKSKRLPSVDLPSFGIYSKPAASAAERSRRIVADPDEDPQKRAAAQFYLDQHPGE